MPLVARGEHAHGLGVIDDGIGDADDDEGQRHQPPGGGADDGIAALVVGAAQQQLALDHVAFQGADILDLYLVGADVEQLNQLRVDGLEALPGAIPAVDGAPYREPDDQAGNAHDDELQRVRNSH